MLFIVGPTCSGKTSLSIAAARLIGSHIISCDSRQFYRGLDVGTAKPEKSILSEIPHHFIDIKEPAEVYSSGEYGKDARAEIAGLVEEQKRCIVVGGSGLYVRALVDGFFDGPGRDENIRNELEEILRTDGIDTLYKMLSEVDPALAAASDKTKPRRIIRALEVYRLTGKTLSQHFAEQSRDAGTFFRLIALAWERGELYRMIEERVDAMIAGGLVDEVAGLKNRGYTAECNALNTVGYKELFEYLDGRTSLPGAIALIKQHTRQFAKRQLTWFRADQRIEWIPADRKTDFERLAKILTGIHPAE